MTNRSRNTYRLLTVLAVTGACASPTYSPPPERAASESCSIGEVWVCRDRYPSRLDTERQPPMICTCENLRGLQ